MMWQPGAVELFSSKLPRALAPPEVLVELDAAERAGDGLLVACSGGADSVGVAVWLAAHFPWLLQEERMVLAHVHHGMRGKEADEDAAMVEALARGLGVGCRIRRFQADPAASEEALRRERMRLLEAMARETAANAIVFGHQADDVLENLIFRMVRGGTLSGIAGLRPRQRFKGKRTRLRPLVRVAREAIAEALQAAGIPWREDASNVASRYTRNRLRNELIPTLEALFPDRDVRACAAALHTELVAADAVVDRLAREWLASCHDSAGLDREALAAQPEAVSRRILEQWSRQQIGRSLRRRVLEAVLGSLSADARRQWAVGDGRFLVLDQGQLSFCVPPQAPASMWPRTPFALKANDSIRLPDGARLIAKIVSLDEIRLNAVRAGGVQPDSEAYLALEDLGAVSELFVRGWQPGDRFRPLGSPGSRKLQDWFTDRRIGPARRLRLPVVCAEDGEILWVPGFPPAQSRSLGPGGRTALWLTYHDQ